MRMDGWTGSSVGRASQPPPRGNKTKPAPGRRWAARGGAMRTEGYGRCSSTAGRAGRRHLVDVALACCVLHVVVLLLLRAGVFVSHARRRQYLSICLYTCLHLQIYRYIRAAHGVRPPAPPARYPVIAASHAGTIGPATARPPLNVSVASPPQPPALQRGRPAGRAPPGRACDHAGLSWWILTATHASDVTSNALYTWRIAAAAGYLGVP